MTNEKFPIGSQWKTRGGWRAVVVSHSSNSCLRVWHENREKDTTVHYPNGRFATRVDDGADLIEPWTEPKKGEFWVNVYEKEDVEGIFYSREVADRSITGYRLACVKVSWTEGEGL
jgi:hypothetical protein